MFSGRLNLIDRPVAKGKAEVEPVPSAVMKGSWIKSTHDSCGLLSGQLERFCISVQRNGAIFPDTGVKHWGA